MREIKFRAWHKKKKRLEQVFGLSIKNGTPFIISTLDEVTGNTVPRGDVENIELMQFTGLLDKNGKEIYEGNIVKYYTTRFKEEKNSPTYCRLDWSELLARFTLSPNIGGEIRKNAFNFNEETTRTMETIGNIYENSELLK